MESKLLSMETKAFLETALKEQQKIDSAKDFYSTAEAEAPISDTYSKTSDHVKDNSESSIQMGMSVPSNLPPELGDILNQLLAGNLTHLTHMKWELQSPYSSITLDLKAQELREDGQSAGGEAPFREY